MAVVAAGEGLRRVLRDWRVCGVCGVEGGQTAALNAFKNRWPWWLGGKACGRFGGFGGFGGLRPGKRQP